MICDIFISRNIEYIATSVNNKLNKRTLATEYCGKDLYLTKIYSSYRIHCNTVFLIKYMCINERIEYG